MPNREWGRDDEQHAFGRDMGRDRDEQWMRDERWRRDMGRDFSRHEWSPYDREREMRDREMRDLREREMRDMREREMRGREMRGDYRESGFGYGGTDRYFGGGGYGGYGNYGERGYGERGYGDYGDRPWSGVTMAQRAMGDRGMYERAPYYQQRPMGRAPRGYQRSDERIKEDLCDCLMRSWVDAENVEIQVRSGEVILSGTVEDRQSKRQVEDLAEQLLGVKDVQNHIRVQRRDGDEQQQQRSGMTTGSQKKPTA